MQGGVAAPASQRVMGLLTRADRDPSGLMGAGIVAVFCAVGSWLFWTPLGIPSQIVRGIVPVGDCSGLTPGSAVMYVCSMKVAALWLVGPIGLIVLAFVFRKTLTALVQRVRKRLPAEAAFLVAPATATLLFALSWAGAHTSTGGLSGILPQTVFPGIVGLFTYAVATWGALIQRNAAPLFDLRDRLSTQVRFVLVIAIPLALSLSMTAESRVSNTAFKEQVVVLVGLACGFLILAPRQGDLMSGVARQMQSLRRR